MRELLESIFKTTKTQISESFQIIPEISSNDIVKAIHGKIDWLAITEQNMDENEIQSLINQKNKEIESISVISRREAVGFNLTKQQAEEKKLVEIKVSKLNQDKLSLETKREQLKELSFIRNKYRFRKFILMSDLEDVCKKYNLAIGYTINYIGELPEKNLQDIENYKKPEEALTIYKIGERSLNYTYEKILYLNLLQYEKRIEESKIRANYSSRYYLNMDKLNTYLIACPRQDLTQTIQEANKVEFKDPIVCYPVHKEYIMEIVTKWGLEASDEVLLNPINN